MSDLHDKIIQEVLDEIHGRSNSTAEVVKTASLLWNFNKKYDFICKTCKAKAIVHSEGVWCLCDGAKFLVKAHEMMNEKERDS